MNLTGKQLRADAYTLAPADPWNGPPEPIIYPAIGPALHGGHNRRHRALCRPVGPVRHRAGGSAPRDIALESGARTPRNFCSSSAANQARYRECSDREGILRRQSAPARRPAQTQPASAANHIFLDEKDRHRRSALLQVLNALEAPRVLGCKGYAYVNRVCDGSQTPIRRPESPAQDVDRLRPFKHSTPRKP